MKRGLPAVAGVHFENLFSAYSISVLRFPAPDCTTRFQRVSNLGSLEAIYAHGSFAQGK